MDAKRLVFRSLFSLRLLCCCMLFWQSGCGGSSYQGPPPALNENKIAKVSKFWRIDTKEELTNHIVVKQGGGFYAVVEIEEQAGHPDELNGNKVTDLERWVCAAVVYPQGASSTSSKAIYFQVQHLYICDPTEFFLMSPAPRGPHMKPPAYQGDLTLKKQPLAVRKNPSRALQSRLLNARFSASREKLGSDGKPMKPPVLDHEFKEGISPMWTFIGAVHDEPGEYTLEILVHPFNTAKMEDSVGDAVSVYKGTLEVLPK